MVSERKGAMARLILLRALLVLAVTSVSLAQTTKPNILFVLVDDMGYNDLSVMGSPDISTPNIDRLALGGAIFPNGYSMARFCSPARAGTLTGINPVKYGHYVNPAHTLEDTEMGLPQNLTLLPETLKSAGYQTIMLGKWHLGMGAGFHPLNRGFNKFFGFLGGKFPYFRTSFFNIQDEIREYIYDNFEVPASVQYLTTEFTNQAIEFITDCNELGRPFFTYLAYNAPHAPYEAPEEEMQRAKSAGVSPDRQVHVAMMQNLDDNIGRLYDHLEALGLLENTLIVFTNDNGGHKEGSNNFPLRDFKSTWWEGGIRVPLFMYWKDTILPAQTIEHPITLLDLYPTFESAAKMSVLKRNPDLDGENLLPYVARAGRITREGPIHEQVFLGGRFGGIIVKDGWKARFYERWMSAMHNLNVDVGETTDVKDNPENRERKLDLQQTFYDWYDANAVGQAFFSSLTTTPMQVSLIPPKRTTFIVGKWYRFTAVASHDEGKPLTYTWESYLTKDTIKADFRDLRSDAVTMSIDASKTSVVLSFKNPGDFSIRVNIADGRFVKWAEWNLNVMAAS